MRKLMDRDHGGTKMQHVNWKPIHTAIVMDSIQGMTVDMIAAKYGYAFSSINNILRSSNARKIRERVERNILEKGVENFDESVKNAKIMAFNNMQKFLLRTDLEEKSPFAFFDRNLKAMETLHKMDTLGKEPDAPHAPSNVNNTQVNIFTDAKKMEELTAGLNKALEVSRLHENLLPESVDGSARQFEGADRSRDNQRKARERETEIIEEESEN